MRKSRFHQGKYTPQKVEKYRGALPIHYLSGLELQFLRWCDKNPRITKWSYEPGRKDDPHKRVWYHCPVRHTDHYYIPDAWIRYVDSDNVVREAYIEIKPMSQVVRPKEAGRGWKARVAEWLKNQAKWAAAKKWAAKQNKGFKVLTENFWRKSDARLPDEEATRRIASDRVAEDSWDGDRQEQADD